MRQAAAVSVRRRVLGWNVHNRQRNWHDVASPGRLGDLNASGVPPLLRSYLSALHSRPLTGAVVSSTLAAVSGDVLAQLAHVTQMDRIGEDWVEHRDSFSAMARMLSKPQVEDNASPELGALRTARFAAVVGLLAGGAGQVWFRYLLNLFPGWTYNSAIRTIVDQSIFAPTVLAATAGSVTISSTGNAAFVRHRFQHDAIEPLGRMWAWWGCGVAVNYILVPNHWQAPFAIAIGSVWCAMLSARLHLPVCALDADRSLTARYLRNQRHFESTTDD